MLDVQQSPGLLLKDTKMGDCKVEEGCLPEVAFILHLGTLQFFKGIGGKPVRTPQTQVVKYVHAIIEVTFHYFVRTFLHALLKFFKEFQRFSYK